MKDLRKILVLGSSGQLGSRLTKALSPLGDVIALSRFEADLSVPSALPGLLRQIAPSLVINAAAYTAVDRAESEPLLAMTVNAEAPGVLARESAKIGAILIHFSTDYVFDGQKDARYAEEDAPNPINQYGKSKLAGEQAVVSSNAAALVFRTSWVYELGFDNFVTRVLGWSRTQLEMRVVSDQIGSPSSARMLAKHIGKMLARAGDDWTGYFSAKGGIYHLAGLGSASRLGLVLSILDADPNPEQQVVKKVIPVSSDFFPAPARRPPNSSLDCSKVQRVFGIDLPPWQVSLREALSRSE